MTGRGSIAAAPTTTRQIVIVVVAEGDLRAGPNRAGTVKECLHLCGVI